MIDNNLKSEFYEFFDLGLIKITNTNYIDLINILSNEDVEVFSSYENDDIRNICMEELRSQVFASFDYAQTLEDEVDRENSKEDMLNIYNKVRDVFNLLHKDFKSIENKIWKERGYKQDIAVAQELELLKKGDLPNNFKTMDMLLYPMKYEEPEE